MNAVWRGALAVLLLVLAWAALELGRLAGEARRDLGGITSQLSTTLAQVNSTERDSSVKLAEEQRQLTETLVAVKHIVQRSDEQLFGRDLHSGLFGQAGTLLATSHTLLLDTDAAVKQAAVTLARASDDLHDSVLDLHTLAASLNADLADPHLKNTFAELDATMSNLAADTAQLKLLLESGTATAEDVRRVADKIAEEYTKAKNLYYAVFKEVLSVGSQGVQFFLKK